MEFSIMAIMEKKNSIMAIMEKNHFFKGQPNKNAFLLMEIKMFFSWKFP
jgi:hypothetical protein